MKKLDKKLLVAACFAATVIGCSDSGTSDSNSDNEGKSSSLEASYATVDDLPNCSSNREGDSAFVAEEQSIYVCQEKKWNLLGEVVETEDDLKNCTESREGSQVYVQNIEKSLVCVDGKWQELQSSSSVKNSGSSSSTVNSESSSSTKSGDTSSSSSQNNPSSSGALDDGYNAEANTLTDARDNQTYKTVSFDISRTENDEVVRYQKVWMAENLNYHYNATDAAKSYCYGDLASNCDKYGSLYSWSAAMDSAGLFSNDGKGCGDGLVCGASENGNVRGVCPSGWHLPSNDEWNELHDAAGGGSQLRSTSNDWRECWGNPFGGGYDSYGFNVLPAGYLFLSESYQSDWGYNCSGEPGDYESGGGNGMTFNQGNYYFAGGVAYFQTSSEYSTPKSYAWAFQADDGLNSYSKDYMWPVEVPKANALSVRCIKD